MKKQDQTVYDVIISGAGPSGLALAKGLCGHGLRIAVIDPAPRKALQDPAYDGRETALTHLSHQILSDLGVLDHLPSGAVSFVKRAAVVDGDSSYALRFDHREAGTDTLGYMASNQAIRRASFACLMPQMAAGGDVDLHDGARVIGLEDKGERVCVTLDTGAALMGRLVVGADGRLSQTRSLMGVPTETLEWGRTCLVGVMAIDGDHVDTAYECFHYDRTLAVLPLNGGRVSIVITLPTQDAEAVVAMDPDEFARDIEARFEGRVGRMTLEGVMHAYPLTCVYARRFYAPRFAVLGDAAVGMHPVTAHGYNLGVRGADTLAKGVVKMARTGGDVGSSLMLAQYNRAHQLVCKPLYMGTNTLVKLYTDTRPAAKAVRKGLLRLGAVLRPVKDVITRQLTELR